MNIPEMKSLCYQMYDNARDVCCDKTKQVLLHKEYYEKGLEHPSKAMLILQDAETKRSNKYKKIAILKNKLRNDKEAFKEFLTRQSVAGQNMLDADAHPLAKSAKLIFADKLRELYPITGPARLAIIDTNTVVLDKFKKVAKGLKKSYLVNLIKVYARKMS